MDIPVLDIDRGQHRVNSSDPRFMGEDVRFQEARFRQGPEFRFFYLTELMGQEETFAGPCQQIDGRSLRMNH